MAKYKVNGQYTGECPATLQDDETPVIDNVLKFTEDRIEFLTTECTQEQYNAGIKFEQKDLITYLNADVTFGASRDSEEQELPHAKATFKIPGSKTYDDVTLEMLMTRENYKKYKKIFDDGVTIAIATFDKDNADSDTGIAPMLESYFGSVTACSVTYTNGSSCTVSVTFAPSAADVECESPDYK
jgi:hypothetical protein